MANPSLAHCPNCKKLLQIAIEENAESTFRCPDCATTFKLAASSRIPTATPQPNVTSSARSLEPRRPARPAQPAQPQAAAAPRMRDYAPQQTTVPNPSASLEGADFWDSRGIRRRRDGRPANIPLILACTLGPFLAILLLVGAGVWWAKTKSQMSTGPREHSGQSSLPGSVPFETEAFGSLLGRLSSESAEQSFTAEELHELRQGLKLGFFRFTADERVNLLKTCRYLVLEIVKNRMNPDRTVQAAWEIAKTTHRYRCEWPNAQTEYERRLVEAARRLDLSSDDQNDANIIEALQSDLKSMHAGQLARSNGVPYSEIGRLRYQALQMQILAEAAAASSSPRLANEMMYVGEQINEFSRDLLAKHSNAIRPSGPGTSDPSPNRRGRFGGAPMGRRPPYLEERASGLNSNNTPRPRGDESKRQSNVWGLRVEAYFLDRSQVIDYIETQLAEFNVRVNRATSFSTSKLTVEGVELDFVAPEFNAPFLAVCTCPGGSSALIDALPKARLRSIDYQKQELRLVIDAL